MFGDFCIHLYNQWICTHDLWRIEDVGLSMLCMCVYACRNMFVSPVIHVCESLELMMSDYWVDHLLLLRESVCLHWYSVMFNSSVPPNIVISFHILLVWWCINYHTRELMIMHMHLHDKESWTRRIEKSVSTYRGMNSDKGCVWCT